MSEQETFVRDFFRLGARPWLRAYAGKRPRDLTEERFVDLLQQLGLELRFIDQKTWTLNDETNLPSYLIYDAASKLYTVYSVDRGIPHPDGEFSSLKDAMLCKTETLYVVFSLIEEFGK